MGIIHPAHILGVTCIFSLTCEIFFLSHGLKHIIHDLKKEKEKGGGGGGVGGV